MNIASEGEDHLIIEFFKAALSGSAITAATRHDAQAKLLATKALEIAQEALELLKQHD